LFGCIEIYVSHKNLSFYLLNPLIFFFIVILFEFRISFQLFLNMILIFFFAHGLMNHNLSPLKFFLILIQSFIIWFLVINCNISKTYLNKSTFWISTDMFDDFYFFYRWKLWKKLLNIRFSGIEVQIWNSQLVCLRTKSFVKRVG
jgi:hypothetical protein